jgi:hypothetical protein
MAYITLANTNKIIFKSDIKELNLQGEIYRIPIYFLSKYEENALLAIQELLKDPVKYFNEIYQPYEAVDTYSYVYEGQQPAYHKFSCCPRLQSDYQNFEIPSDIQEKGPEAVKEFREWFEEVKYLLDRPDVFVARLQARWGIVTNPKAINRDNSGSTIIENLTIKELEDKIDTLIKEAGRFYYKSNKNKEILKRFSKFTFIAYKDDDIHDNDTKYSDEEVRQLLKHYDEEYKRPLKKYLIEYYRLKHNPEIKMEGYLLDRLGFNPCGNCHDDEYEPESKKDEIIFTFDFLLENSLFFLTMFSLYYSFSEKQLIEFKDTLIFGSIEESHEDHSIPQTMYAKYGLNFNDKIEWTKNVSEAYWVEPCLIHAFGSEDVWYKRDFERLPLSKESELDFFRNYSKNWAFTYSEDLDETMECIERDEIFSKELEKALLQNKFESCCSYINSFNNDNKYEIIKLIFNGNFYKQMFEKIKKDCPKFEIEDYLRTINTAHNSSN